MAHRRIQWLEDGVLTGWDHALRGVLALSIHTKGNADMVDGLSEAEFRRITEYFDLSQGNERLLSIWIIGRPAAGKTTTATLLRDLLRQVGHRVELVDGEAVRALFDGDLGHSRGDRLVALHRVVKINQLLQGRGIIPITATIMGSRHVRGIALREVGNARFVFLDCPFEVAARRDQKGLYAKAVAGGIKDFTGVDMTFESPTRYECELKINSAKSNPAEIVAKIVKHFRQNDFFCEASGVCEQSEKIRNPETLD